jgi:hypothetical protein
MVIKDINERLNKALGKDGLDIERRSRNAGKRVAAGWGRTSRVMRDVWGIFGHEKRIEELEKDVEILTVDVLDLKKWLQDVDNRTQLLEYYHNYDLDDIQCHECNSPMRVKRNRETREFFLGCLRWKTHQCTGSRPISGPVLEQLAVKYRAA